MKKTLLIVLCATFSYSCAHIYQPGISHNYVHRIGTNKKNLPNKFKSLDKSINKQASTSVYGSGMQSFHNPYQLGDFMGRIPKQK